MLHSESTKSADTDDIDDDDIDELRVEPMILIQCISHTLSLLMKDIAKHFPWVRGVYKQALTISKAMNKERIYAMCVDACKADQCKPLAIITLCETRFGSNHPVMRSVQNVMGHLRTLVASDEFASYSKGEAVARKLGEIMNDMLETSFRSRAPIVEELMAPVMEEMHRLKSDQAMVSYISSAIRALNEGAAEFSTKYPELSSTNVLAMPSTDV